MPSVLLRGGELVDPANGRHGVADLLFEDGRVVAVDAEIPPPRGVQIVDARGSLVLPGLVDTHTHIAEGRWQGHAMMARAGVTTALNLSGRMPDVLEGITRAGAGLTVVSLDSLTPNERLSGTTPAEPAARSASRSSAATSPSRPPRRPTSSGSPTSAGRTSPSTSGPPSTAATWKGCARPPSWPTGARCTWPTSTAIAED
jgi:hypothetical protein